jgi:SAM-dependent methyltransferase
MPWPLPALLTWAASWGMFIVASRWLGLPPVSALLLAAGIAIILSLRGDTRWRRIFMACGFPLSLAASGLAADVPGWAWLLPLLVLALMYPVQTWRDAPLFPTPRGALKGLAALVPLPRGAMILDAGCGLGHGLVELHREYPHAALTGFEWSWPLRLACAWRTRWARVRRADIWAADWSGYDMVYVFQRSDSMSRAAAKAAQELRAGAWMASLEFSVPELCPTRTLACGDGRCVWLYQAPFKRR